MTTSRSLVLATTVVSVAALVGVGGGYVASKFGSADRPTAAEPNSTLSQPTSGAGSVHPSTPTGSAPSTTASATTATTTSSEAPLLAVPLYYADGAIHDGTAAIDYSPRFSADVSGVTRTNSGWLVSERIGQDGSRLVLVSTAGDATPVDSRDPHSFDVSAEGNAVAVPRLTRPVIDIIDPADGARVMSVTTPLASVRQVRFAGTSLVFDGYSRSGKLQILRTDFRSDQMAVVGLRVPVGEATLEDVSADGTLGVAGYLSGSRPCIAGFELQGDSTPLWTKCGVTPAGGTSISPDGTSVAVLTAGGPSGSPPSIQTVSTQSGAVTGVVAATLPVGATWADSSHLLVESATDNSYTAYTLSRCTLTGDCAALPGADTGDPAADVAAGWTY